MVHSPCKRGAILAKNGDMGKRLHRKSHPPPVNAPFLSRVEREREGSVLPVGGDVIINFLDADDADDADLS